MTQQEETVLRPEPLDFQPRILMKL